jgi:uncharacterized coiled-coil DUF342 family protein
MEIAMSEDSLTVHILRDLRDELRSTGDELRQRIDSMNQRIDHLEHGFRAELRTEIAAVRDHIVESELRMATRFVEQTAATRDLYDLLNANLQLRDRVERCEHDIADLKDRVV